MPDTVQRHIVELQFEELVKSYSDIELKRNEDGSFLISGDFSFSAEYNGITIADKFALVVSVPNDYPTQIPLVKETGGRIPNDFHTNPDGSLCLNVPIELRKMFHSNGTLSDFMNQSVIHFLYAFCYQKKHGEMPYGEWSHGGKGILEYYRSILKVGDDVSVVGLLRILADDDYRGHVMCPCGKEIKLRKCHGSQLRDISSYQSASQFMYDYEMALRYILNKKKSVPGTFISKILKKKYKGLREVAI